MDSSQNDPVQKKVWQPDSSKILFPCTPPPPQWKGAPNTPAPPQITDSVEAPVPPEPLNTLSSSAPQNTFPQPEMEDSSLLCGLCKEICKRGVKLDCCEARACRACAIKEITSTRSCWVCPTLGHINIINDDLLRSAVKQFNNREIVLPPPPGSLNTPGPPQTNKPAPLYTPDPPRWKGPLNTPVISDNNAIVIEDDKQSNTIEDLEDDKHSNPIEDLGEEMLDFVNEEAFSQLVGVQVPDTPETILKQMDFFKDDIKYSSDESKKNEEDEIIFIDDNDNDIEVDQDSDLEIVEEVSVTKSSNIKPMTTTNIQNVTDGYQPPSLDFIGFEIDTRPGEPIKTIKQDDYLKDHTMKWKEMRKNKVGRKKFGREQHKNPNTTPLGQPGTISAPRFPKPGFAPPTGAPPLINTEPLPSLVTGLGGPSNMMDFMLQSNMKTNEGAGPR